MFYVLDSARNGSQSLDCESHVRVTPNFRAVQISIMDSRVIMCVGLPVDLSSSCIISIWVISVYWLLYLLFLWSVCTDSYIYCFCRVPEFDGNLTHGSRLASPTGMKSNTSPDGIQEDLDQNDEQPAYRDAAYMSDDVSSGDLFFLSQNWVESGSRTRCMYVFTST